ncbi:MAG: AbrB/MazE/SpoVT family DNA-binding domain-containing protein [bacterium]
MKTKIIQIGNSQGIRIPKVLLQQSGLGKEVELEVKKQNIIIGPIKKSRQGWSDAFRKMAERGVDQLIDRDALVRQSSWDKSHWTW